MLRASVARRAEDWRWGSLHRWNQGTAKVKSLLAAWPLPRRAGWVQQVNAPQTEAELSALRRSIQRGFPFGEASWCDRMVQRSILQILQPLYEPMFSRLSFGYRPRLDRRHALATAERLTQDRGLKVWIVDDIADCFDHIPCGRLLQVLS
ncbi:MAG: hypothetical protein ACYC3X_25020 [Pirellulaceae bacterium]